jgi:uncharacterized membrane protein YczE
MVSFDQIRKLLTPHKTVPITPWRASHRWDLSVSRVSILFFGLIIFGLGDSLLVQGDVGNAPWTVLAQGFTKRFDISIGLATFLISTVVLLIWIPLREKPGFGTVSNIVLIASAIEIGIHIFPLQHSIAMGVIFDCIGIAMVGLGSALYLSCGLGSGPRDGAMTGIHYRTGIRVGRVRLGIEVFVLFLGGLMGGRVGIGTALFALFIGQSVAIFLGILARLTQA